MSVDTECPVEIVPIDGKGLGVRATAHIAEGTIVRVPPENIRHIPFKEWDDGRGLDQVRCGSPTMSDSFSLYPRWNYATRLAISGQLPTGPCISFSASTKANTRASCGTNAAMIYFLNFSGIITPARNCKRTMAKGTSGRIILAHGAAQ